MFRRAFTTLRFNARGFFQSSARQNAAESKSTGFFQSDTWIKGVGTVGALFNWTIPLAGIAHMQSDKDPATTINGPMTCSLIFYSFLFMRWSLAISPANYPLLVCHGTNEVIQCIQLGRHINALNKAEKK